MSASLTTDLVRILQIVWLDLLLSGDNAVVIALACRSLPDRERKRAIGLGAGAAILLRILFALALIQILRLPYLKLVGAVLLVWIGVRLMNESKPDEQAAPVPTLWAAVRIIALADALMSLDNVLAITAAARGDPLLVSFGLLLSLPLVVFGASLFVSLLKHSPWLLWASAGLVGWSAEQLAMDDPLLATRLDLRLPYAELIAGAAGACLVLAAAAAEALSRRLRS